MPAVHAPQTLPLSFPLIPPLPIPHPPHPVPPQPTVLFHLYPPSPPHPTPPSPPSYAYHTRIAPPIIPSATPWSRPPLGEYGQAVTDDSGPTQQPQTKNLNTQPTLTCYKRLQATCRYFTLHGLHNFVLSIFQSWLTKPSSLRYMPVYRHVLSRPTARTTAL